MNSNINLKGYQEKIKSQALDILETQKRVGFDIFTRGGKSYIAVAVIEELVDDYKCNKIAVFAPKSVLMNLQNNIFSQFKYFNKMCFINYEKLSRLNSIEDCIRDCGVNPEDIDIILFDEAHMTFGTNIRYMIESSSKYVYSRYFIAMTATSESNLKGIDTLQELVGKNNIIKYSYKDAVNDNVAKPVNYIPAIINYSTVSTERLSELKGLNAANPYILNVIRQLEVIVKSLNVEISDRIYNYIKDSVKLSSEKGGRVFVFFNTVDEVVYYRESIEETVRKLYKYWGNKRTKIKYINYTSKISSEENDKALRIIGEKATPGQIDIIATVNKGAMGIHPDNVHFGIIMCSTKSVPRLLQMIGRLTNLCGYDEYETNIFDMRANVKLLGNTSINVGKKHIRDRRKYKRNEAIARFSNEDIFSSDKFSQATIKGSDELELSLSLFDRIENLTNIKDNSIELINFIEDNIEIIDNKFNGNIAKYIKAMQNHHNNCEYTLEELICYMDKLNKIRNAMLFDGYTKEDKEYLNSKIGIFGHRIYLTNSISPETEDYIKELYYNCENVKDLKRIPKKFKDQYAISYLSKRMSSICMAIIQRYENIEIQLTNCIANISAKDFGIDDDRLGNLCKKAGNILKNTKCGLNTLPDEIISDNLNKANCMLEYVKYIATDKDNEVYLDSYIDYLESAYGDMLDQFGPAGEHTINKIMTIINAEVNNEIHNLSISSDTTLAYIANNFSSINTIYRNMLKLHGISTLKQFNERIVLKSKMGLLALRATDGDNNALSRLRDYMWGDQLPYAIKSILKCDTIQNMLMDITPTDIKRAVQSMGYTPTESSKILKKLIKNNTITYTDVIALTFVGDKCKKVKNLLDNYSCSCEENIVQVKKLTDSISITLLEAILNKNILDKKYNQLVKQLIA